MQAGLFLDRFEGIPDVGGCVIELGPQRLSDGRLPPRLIKGEDHLIEHFGSFPLRIGYRSFMQANWPVYQAIGQKLYDWIGETRGQRVLELYAGVGGIGNWFG